MSLRLKILTGLGLFIIKAIHSNALLADALKQHRVCRWGSVASPKDTLTVLLAVVGVKSNKKIIIHKNSGTKTLSSIRFLPAGENKITEKKIML